MKYLIFDVAAVPPGTVPVEGTLKDVDAKLATMPAAAYLVTAIVRTPTVKRETVETVTVSNGIPDYRRRAKKPEVMPSDAPKRNRNRRGTAEAATA